MANKYFTNKYLHRFSGDSYFNDFVFSDDYYEPFVSTTYLGEGIVDRVDYNLRRWNKMISSYLTFNIESDGNIYFKTSNTALTKTIEYSIDNGQTWTELTSASDNSASISVETGDKVIFRGENTQYATGAHRTYFDSTADFYLYGNIMSLTNYDDFKRATEFNDNWVFNGLFRGCTHLTSAEDLALPATALTYGCYYQLFYECTNLEVAPELHATTLAQHCYAGMFTNCTSLEAAPELPATTLEYACYNGMFMGCSNLTTVQELLPATSLIEGCYKWMFGRCTSLTTAPAFPVTTLTCGLECCLSMYEGCTSLVGGVSRIGNANNVIADGNITSGSCFYQMFKDCTALVIAPELPATNLGEFCYWRMFQGCTALVNAPELPAITLAYKCYFETFKNCTNVNYIKAMFTTLPTGNVPDYTEDWVDGVQTTAGTFVKNSSATWSQTGVHGVPDNWTVVTA